MRWIQSLLVTAVTLLCLPAIAETTYTVQSGDIAGSIAERFDCTVEDLVRWNPDLNPDQISVGQEIRILEPSEREVDPGEGVYVVRPGDTLMGIAEGEGVSYAALLEANDDVNPDRISVGQHIIIPEVSASTASSSPYRGGNVYVVQPGDTLSAIASSHSISVEDLLRWNDGLNPDRIQVGQEIEIRSMRPTRQVTYEVQSGDTLGHIAEEYNVTIDELTNWNRGLNPDRIRVGQSIKIIQEGPEERSESYGAAYEGRLINGEQLPEHPAFRVRHGYRAWGTNEAVTNLIAGYQHIRRNFSRAPKVWVHDLSFQQGGPMEPHRSHQSGRDADIGYYHTDCPDGLCPYRAIHASELQPRYQWALFEYWIEHDLVDYIFVDYTLQERLYKHLEGRGYSRRKLREVFQYPRGRHSGRGIIRHEPGHRTHFHVRFSCASDDDRCQ
jgi:LysM repeat protein